MNILTTFWQHFLTLLTAPSTHPAMFWIILPLIIIIILMTVYFAKYKDEELGWNTALGNSLVLIFVSVDLFRTILTDGKSTGALILASILMLEGIILLFVNFTHILPKKIAYFLSAPLSINLTAYVFITIIYTQAPVNIHTILAAILLFAILFGFFLGMGYISKRWWARVERIKANEHVEDVKQEKKILEKKKKEIKQGEKKIKRSVKKHEKEFKDKRKELQKIRNVVTKRKK